MQLSADSKINTWIARLGPALTHSSPPFLQGQCSSPPRKTHLPSCSTSTPWSATRPTRLKGRSTARVYRLRKTTWVLLALWSLFQSSVPSSPSHPYLVAGRARRRPGGHGRDDNIHANREVRRSLLPHGLRRGVRPRQGSLRPHQHGRLQPGRQRIRERRRGRLCQASHFRPILPRVQVRVLDLRRRIEIYFDFLGFQISGIKPRGKFVLDVHLLIK